MKTDYTRFKKGEKVICIQDAGLYSFLKKGETYTILKAYRLDGAEHVDIIGDNFIKAGIFANRFTNLKRERKEKLKKLNGTF